MTIGTLVIDNAEFVVVPKAEWLRLLGKAAPETLSPARQNVRTSIGHDLRQAREAAGLTQADLAKKLKKSQAMVSGAENGTVKTGWPYAKAVLKACGLPDDWQAPG
jgi:ribosome-binding protein aMBF1 (putative translation factor)